MALTVPTLDDLDQEAVDQAVAYAVARMAEYAPELDGRRGVLHDLVARLHAALEASVVTYADRLDRSRSLAEIEADPALADPALVDAVLSNFRLTRRAGTPARGTVAVVLEGPFVTTVPRGTVFAAGTARFAADDAYAARLSAAEVLGPADRLLTPLDGGRYQFLVDVTSLGQGDGFRLRRNDRLTPELPLPRFADAYAAADFTGGFAAESNAELLARLRDGLAAASPSNRLTLEALVRGSEDYGRTQAISVAGAGDPEQVRARGLFPVALGRADVYARTRSLPALAAVTLPAARVGEDADGTIYQVSVGRDDAPGFYDLAGAAFADAAGGRLVKAEEVSRGYNLTGLDWAPDLASAEEAAYSRYQTAVVRVWAAPAADAAAERQVTLTVRLLPELAGLSDYLLDRSRRPFGCDLLVKAAVPVFCGAALTVYYDPARGRPDASPVRAAVAAAANATGFCGRLSAADLSAAALAALGAGRTVGRLALTGVLRRPDGVRRRLRSAEFLEVPEEPAAMTSPRTAVFYLDPADVGVELVAGNVC